jgi:hypothetical protein
VKAISRKNKKFNQRFTNNTNYKKHENQNLNTENSTWNKITEMLARIQEEIRGQPKRYEVGNSPRNACCLFFCGRDGHFARECKHRAPWSNNDNSPRRDFYQRPSYSPRNENYNYTCIKRCKTILLEEIIIIINNLVILQEETIPEDMPIHQEEELTNLKQDILRKMLVLFIRQWR